MIVTVEQYDKWANDLLTLRTEIRNAKRPVYTHGSGDVFRNFRVGAAMTGSTPGHDLSHHLVKQANAVINLLIHPDIPDAERATRFADLMNYAELAYVMWMSNQHGESPL